MKHRENKEKRNRGNFTWELGKRTRIRCCCVKYVAARDRLIFIFTYYNIIDVLQ